MAPTYPLPPVRRRRRWPLVLLIVVIVLVGLFVAADRIALSLAEDKAAAALQSSQGLRHKPDVSVEGFPFLTQLLGNRFGEIIVTANDVPVGSNQELTIQRVTLDLHDVTVSDNYSTVHATTATADGVIGYGELSKALHTAVRAGPNGRLVARPTVHLLGRAFHGMVSAIVHASTARGITFGAPRASLAGVTFPPPVARALAQVFSTVISLAGLPFGVQVTGADVTSSGLVLKLAGHDLTYRR
jgi:hypothetical protein